MTCSRQPRPALPSGVVLLALTLAASSSLRAEPSTPTLDRWLVLGPIPVSEAAPEPGEDVQRKAFDDDQLAACGGEGQTYAAPPTSCAVSGHDLAWKEAEPAEGRIDLAQAVGARDYALAYAWTEVSAPEASSVLLGLGSDDAVKVWLNGELVHRNWVMRALSPDQDLVALDLRKGRNQVLLKIQNGSQAWAFAARFLDSATLAEALWDSAADGDVDRVEKILSLDKGLDVDAATRYGLTAWQIAGIFGRTDAAELLAARGADVTLPQPAPEATVTGMLSKPTAGRTPGVAVLVSKDGEILYSRGFGFASLEHSVPVTPQTKFRIGSITKQFTAAAILRLQEQGKLSVSDPLSKYLPDFPRGNQVTLHQLLNHTSGIHSYTNDPDFLETVTVPIESTEKLIESFQNDPYDFEPGTRWAYNNSGYVLLGHIVEKVSGQSYGDFLEAQFFDPLGMRDTGVHRHDAILEHEATGYSYQGGRLSKALDWDMSRAGGAGQLYSTVEDLERWNEGVFGGKVLSEASLEAAFSPVSSGSPPEPSSEGYGYGWGIREFRGLLEIQHGGGLHGFVSHLRRYPSEHMTIAVLVNATPPPPGLDPDRLGTDIAQVYLADEMEARPAPKVVRLSAEKLQAFVGRYDYGTAVMTVTREGQRLFAQLPGQPRLEILPKSDHEFFSKVVEAEVSFITDDTGKVVKAHHRQGGAEFDAPRLPD